MLQKINANKMTYPHKQTGSQSPAVSGTPLDLIPYDVIWLCFPRFVSVKSQMCQQEVAPVTHRIQISSTLSQGRAYTLHNPGGSAWER
ncbi:hypothetical protein Celaphus_00017394, partial [Cervus elaphus hippelaphus]